MYIKRTYDRMKNMQKNTWRFVSMCFALIYLYLIAAIAVLIANDVRGSFTVISYAMEMVSASQAVMIVCAVGSVVIEETTLHKGK